MIVPKSNVAICSLFSLIGFILLVVATCSVPVNENIYLFELRGVTSNQTTIARVGVLGLCGDSISRSAGGQWSGMHDCSKEGLGFPITTTREVHKDESGRIVPVKATVADRELTRALVFNPLAGAFAGIATIVGMFTYAIDPCLCLSIWTYIMLAIYDHHSTVKSRVNDFATSPDQVITLKIGPTSWIALAGALVLTAGLLAWTTETFRSSRPHEIRRHSRTSRKGSQGSVSSMGHSSTNSSRRTSYV